MLRSGLASIPASDQSVRSPSLRMNRRDWNQSQFYRVTYRLIYSLLSRFVLVAQDHVLPQRGRWHLPCRSPTPVETAEDIAIANGECRNAFAQASSVAALNQP